MLHVNAPDHPEAHANLRAASDPDAAPVAADGSIHPAHAAEKVAQARVELEAQGIDVWLTFVRRTDAGGDPVLPMILDRPLSFPSALIIPRAGIAAEPTAIVSHYQAATVRETGAWPTIISFVNGASDALRQALVDLEPQRIAINTSQRDPAADGLSHAMWQLLHEWLAGTGLGDRFVSSEDVIAAVRGRKTPREIAALRNAIDHTNAVWQDAMDGIIPGLTERALGERFHRQSADRGLDVAWSANTCPSITTGPEGPSASEHPSDTARIEPGRVLHVDFGVRSGGFCSDLKRCWYVPSTTAPTPPASVSRAFDAVRDSIDAAMDALRPGAVLAAVDDAARSTLLAAGFPEYTHGTGHQIGRSVHDGGGIIGPRWERYGDAVLQTAETGQVFTLELGVVHPEAGYVGLEEMVEVTADGCLALSRRQTDLWILGPPRERIC
ncbi:MAG: M24 family metallopeptidase [Phycisphaerales bacterium]